MPTTFTVTPQELFAIANRVSATAHALRDAAPNRAQYDGAAGTRAVDDALESFFGDSAISMEHIAQELDDVMGRLVDAADAYSAADKKVRDAAGGGSG